MRPMLDDIALPQVQTVHIRDARALAEHRSPEMDGSYFQNLGRRATTIHLAGVASGTEALAFLETLTQKFDTGDPVTFVSDIATDAEIGKVLIDDLKTREMAGKPERFAYAMVLREFLEPAEPDDLSLLDDGILDDATSLIDGLVEGLDLWPDLATGLERFVQPLTDLLGRLQELNRSRGN
jgi:hypothetical protein